MGCLPAKNFNLPIYNNIFMKKYQQLLTEKSLHSPKFFIKPQHIKLLAA